jgi:hypothetical protein
MKGRAMSNKSKNRRGGMLRKCFLAILWGACLLCLSPHAWNQETSEWKLRVAIENAALRQKPDLASPIVATVAKGTILNSNEVEGAWFRVSIARGKEGAAVVGYIASNEVEILEEKIKRPPEFWEEPVEEFHGLGFNLKLAAGLNLFSGGDFYRGAAGMFDSNADAFISSGYTQESRKAKSFRSGFEGGGDIIYHVSPHLGVGLGMDYIHARAESLFVFHGQEAIAFKLWSTPWINAFSIKLGLFYDLPVSSWLTVCFNGGPALFLVKYNYNRNVLIPGVADDFYQQAKAHGIGFRGGLGLEIHLNQRAAVLLEAQGRYARITGFEGSEKFSHEVSGWPTIREEQGSLYYVEAEKYAELAVLSEGAANIQNAGKAVLDFTGISLLAGLRFRF